MDPLSEKLPDNDGPERDVTELGADGKPVERKQWSSATRDRPADTRLMKPELGVGS